MSEQVSHEPGGIEQGQSGFVWVCYCHRAHSTTTKRGTGSATVAAAQAAWRRHAGVPKPKPQTDKRMPNW